MHTRHGVSILLVPDNARRYVERTLHSANIAAQWMRAPTAEQIAARDEDSMVKEIGALVEEIDPDDRAVAAKLIAERPPEDLVAMLVAQLRQRRPAPEVLTEPPSMRPQRPQQQHDRPDRRPHQPQQRPAERPSWKQPEAEQVLRQHGARPPMGPTTWFTINVGRSKNADPKWIVPLLCRRGGISKREIGKIQIMQRETRVEISAEASERFAQAVRQPDPKDKHIHIEPLDVAG